MIITSSSDIENHFAEHEKNRDEIMDRKIKYLENCHDPMTAIEVKVYEELDESYQNLDCKSFGDYEIEYGKITMYVGHEGSVLENIKFCPFCGKPFEVQK